MATNKKINQAVRLSMRKRLSEKIMGCKQWFTQKVQLLHNFMKSSRLNKIVKQMIQSETKTKKPVKKTTTPKKTAKVKSTKK
jgi:hypothetical protein|tara:strand:+ start:996 stop:1241 length:246 start_codon:yes stop_codon:yes gene_type:complete